MAAKLTSGFSLALGLIAILAGLVGCCGLVFWLYEVSNGAEDFDIKAFSIILIVIILLLTIGIFTIRNGFREEKVNPK